MLTGCLQHISVYLYWMASKLAHQTTGAVEELACVGSADRQLR